MLVLFFKNSDGSVPMLEWMNAMRTADPALWAKCAAVIEALEDHGPALRRPLADSLRDGIHELRLQRNGVNYRILYFFSGKDEATISHCVTKTAKVPPSEINLAAERKSLVAKDRKYVYVELENEN